MLKCLFLTMFTFASAFAGHQFSYTYVEEMADIKVFVVENAAEADVIAYRSKLKLDDPDCWLQEVSLDEAELKLMEVDFQDQAELTIYFTDDRDESSESCY